MFPLLTIFRDSLIASVSKASLPIIIPSYAFCTQLLIVIVSIVLFITDINDPNVIGIEIASIIFIRGHVFLSSAGTS